MIASAEKLNYQQEPVWETNGPIEFSDAALDALARLLIDIDEKYQRGEIKP